MAPGRPSGAVVQMALIRECDADFSKLSCSTSFAYACFLMRGDEREKRSPLSPAWLAHRHGDSSTCHREERRS